MPKDDGQQSREPVRTVDAAGANAVASSSNPSGGSKGKAAAAAKVLKRNQACLACRKRKLKCDAQRPVCKTCERSYRHARTHTKAGDPPVPPPSCAYEDLPDGLLPLPPPPRADVDGDGSSSAGGSPSAVSALETRVRELETMLAQAAAVSGIGDLAAGGRKPEPASGPPSFVASSGWAQQSANAATGPSSLHGAVYRPDLLLPHPMFPGALDQSRSALAQDNLTSSAHAPFPPARDPVASGIRPSTIRPFDVGGPRNLPPAASAAAAGWGPPLAQFAQAIPDGQLGTHRPGPPPPLPSQPVPTSALFGVLGARDSPFPSSLEPAKGTFGGSVSDYIARNHRLPTFVDIDTAPPSPPLPPPPPPITRQSDDYAYSSPHGFSTAWLTYDPIKGKAPALIGGTEVRATEPSPPSADALHDLLWPGYPPHLPSPAMLERCVDTVFAKWGLASHLLNRSRFLSRLALPPLHELYPHPAVLHAICALASFWLGDIYLSPAHQKALYHQAERPKSNKNALSSDRRPCWDGLGQPPASTRQGIDGDFGEIHFSWFCLYMEDDIGSPSCWKSIVLATAIAVNYCHMSARWVEGWAILAPGARVAVPITLHAKAGPSTKGWWNGKPSLLPPAEDAIEQQERDNLWWYMLTLDANASTSSTWPGAIDDQSTTIPIPGNFGATEPKGEERQSAQTLHSPDLFFRHPPGTTSFTMLIKSVLLLRNVNRLVRLVDATAASNTQQTAEFRALDQLITTFRNSFPTELRDPIRGGVVDIDLFAAHCTSLVACIQLHERFGDPADDSNPSNVRILASARALLGFVHRLSTTFDLTMLYPFTSFAFFAAGRLQIRWLQAALDQNDVQLESALRSEIDVFRLALMGMGERLPIGSRQGRMLEKLLADLDRRNPGDMLGRNHIIQFFDRPSPAGPARGSIVEISTDTSQPLPAPADPAGFGHAVLPTVFPPSPWPQNLASVLDGELSTLGAPLESWLLDEETFGFGSITDDGRPSPGPSYFFAPVRDESAM